ncbi:MAG: hypothetical protein QY331_06370 [Melioribacteraceae bacterium]|nr:MAG: hypothetical protein QY331_06370 [Melioribacteraceae bacterium]
MSKKIESALPSLALVFGYIAIKELQDDSDRIEILTRLGYGDTEISKICGLTPNMVRVKRFRKKKNKGGKSGKKSN